LALNDLPPLQSQNSKFDADGMEDVKADLQTLSILTRRDSLIHLSAGDRLVVPVDGNANIFLTPSLATVSSSTQYHTITCLRSGQAFSTFTDSAVSLVTSDNELVAYQEYFMGTIPVSRGNVISANVAVTGAPTPLLSSDNFSLRCELTAAQYATR
jgi:hypothetical protein